MTEIKDQIIREIQDSDRPVLTVEELSAELGESDETINDNVDELVEEDRVEKTEIDGKPVYHIRKRDYPKHKKPDHYCGKCGREVHENGDYGRVEFQRHFTSRQESGDHWTEEILCRFCFHDFICWSHDDEHLMHVYPHVEDWDIPEYQLETIKNDPEIKTEYPTKDE